MKRTRAPLGARSADDAPHAPPRKAAARRRQEAREAGSWGEYQCSLLLDDTTRPAVPAPRVDHVCDRIFGFHAPRAPEGPDRAVTCAGGAATGLRRRDWRDVLGPRAFRPQRPFERQRRSAAGWLRDAGQDAPRAVRERVPSGDSLVRGISRGTGWAGSRSHRPGALIPRRQSRSARPTAARASKTVVPVPASPRAAASRPLVIFLG